MPYSTHEYLNDKHELAGKTIAVISGDKSHLKMLFTDGTYYAFVACVEHEKKPERKGIF